MEHMQGIGRPPNGFDNRGPQTMDGAAWFQEVAAPTYAEAVGQSQRSEIIADLKQELHRVLGGWLKLPAELYDQDATGPEVGCDWLKVWVVLENQEIRFAWSIEPLLPRHNGIIETVIDELPHYRDEAWLKFMESYAELMVPTAV